VKRTLASFVSSQIVEARGLYGVAAALNSFDLSDSLFALPTKSSSSNPPIITVAASGAPALPATLENVLHK
jgi:hypothetical protein